MQHPQPSASSLPAVDGPTILTSADRPLHYAKVINYVTPPSAHERLEAAMREQDQKVAGPG